MEQALLEENWTLLYHFLSKSLEVSQEQLRGRVQKHPPAHTIAEWLPFAKDFDGIMCKNLFLKDKKKGSLFLVVAVHDTEIDMKKLTKYLKFKSGNLRFAADEILYQSLRVPQGSVTPLGLIFDDQKKVNVIIDARMVPEDNSEQKLLFHPLSNEYTMFITSSELEKFLKATGHNVTRMDFNKLE
eukprot:TRINITY_DN14951_c0_g1_i1.p1 TRINITY_DN14951_c0_g1~~TRINITY_DN14951_c0_g1_i1.p1  ORF type:complete len:185 (-),score=26.97 TRINITY_DN14951_c0_g1_i1:5-559(-)